MIDKSVYTRTCTIDDINQYSIMENISINPDEELQHTCRSILEQVLKSDRIKTNDRTILDISECIIVDCLYTKYTKFSDFHTDLEYNVFKSESFNIWYLLENNQSYGNMFLLESDTYKKEYTPCFLKQTSPDTLSVTKNTILHAISNYDEEIASIPMKNCSIKYLNMKNKDCLVMGKHMPHRTDLRRDDMFKGLNFRVVIRNKDGSIYHSGDKQYMKYHNIYNATESKLFNVGMFDFI